MFLSSRISDWFFLMLSISLLNFSFCIVFLISLNCSYFFSCSSLSFLKQLFQIFYQINWRSPCLWGWLLKDCFDPLVVPFLWLFMFPEILHCYLCIWSNSHPQSLLTAFRGEMPSISPPRDSEVSSNLLWIHLLHASLLPLEADILSLSAFSDAATH